MLDELDEGTRQDLERDPGAMAQLALLARITAHLGLIGSMRMTCPNCRTVDALLLNLRAGGHTSCSECRRRTTLGELLRDRDHRDELYRTMRGKPRP